jgi:hypothetical protein
MNTKKTQSKYNYKTTSKTININNQKQVNMKTLEQIFDIIENNKISIHEYEKNGILCGYELNAYTQGGVNEILFLDFRDDGKDPKNSEHFINEFESLLNCETIEERIELNRQSESYRNAFSLQESLEDFTEFDRTLRDILREFKEEQGELKTFEIESRVTRIEFATVTAKSRKEAIQIAEESELLNWEVTHDEERQLVSIS